MTTNSMMELALALKERYPYNSHPRHFKFDFPAIDSGGWLRMYFGTDRHFFLREKEEVIKLVESFGFAPSFDIAWVWEDVYNDEFNVLVHQPTSAYVLFVSGSDKNSTNKVEWISDTTDNLYDFKVKYLSEAIAKNRTTPVAIANASRNLDGFVFCFQTKKACLEFETNQPFDRVLSWRKVNSSYCKYSCQLYMRDKEPAEVVSLKQLFGDNTIPRIATKKQVKVKKLSASELYAKVQSGELSLDEFSKLIENC